MAAKRIGFVDDDLENFHANVYLKILRGDLKDRGFEVAGCWALKEKEGREWAAKNSVPYFASVEEMNRQVDCYAVLAPSTPETHLALCQKVFPHGKPTYVDKTFAPDLKTAEEIFALGDRYGVAMQTTSALRYTDVQDYVAANGGREAVRHMAAWGGGRSFGEYAIHPVEIVVSCMGPEAKRLMRRGTGDQSQLLIDFSGGRTAVVNVYCNAKTPYSAAVTTVQGTQFVAVDGSRLFVRMAEAMIGFLAAGKADIPREESLMIRRILDAAGEQGALEGFVAL